MQRASTIDWTNVIYHGKTFAARTWAKCTQTTLVEIQLSSETTVSDLMGCVRPLNFAATVGEIVESVKITAKRLSNLYESPKHTNTLNNFISEFEKQPIADFSRSQDNTNYLRDALDVLCEWHDGVHGADECVAAS